MTQTNVLALIAILATLIGMPSASLAATTETAGDVVAVLVPIYGIALASVKHDREGQIQFLESLAANAVVTVGLKAAINKRRPDGTCCDSFPSAHSSLAFMGAAFLQRRYGQKFVFPAYAAATFVAYSRVESDKHYVEDVVAGAAIGYLSARYFTAKFKGLSATPVAGDGYVGIKFAGTW